MSRYKIKKFVIVLIMPRLDSYYSVTMNYIKVNRAKLNLHTLQTNSARASSLEQTFEEYGRNTCCRKNVFLRIVG